MSSVPSGHVVVRDELLYSDASWIHVIGGKGFELSAEDSAILGCVLRGESELGTLCRQLARLEIGGDPDTIATVLRERFADPRSLLDLRPAVYDGEPEIIVCDFSNHRWPGDSLDLVRKLRRTHKTLFLGIKENMTSRSRDNLWPERLEGRGPYGTWFAFAQLARSLIRFHSNAVLVLAGHTDAVLFGDLTGAVPSCFALDSTWPTVTPLEDLRGERASTPDVLPELRKLFYALRFAPLKELNRLNRLNSSALATLEEYAIRNADVLLYTSTDQVRELRRDGRAPAELVPFCPPRRAARPTKGDAHTLVLVADLETGLDPLAPFLSILGSPEHEGLFDVLAIWTSSGWFKLKVDESVAGLARQPGPLALSEYSAGLVFPGLTRNVTAATIALTSNMPVLVVPSAQQNPLQQELDDVHFLRETTREGAASAIRDLRDPESQLRKDLVEAQRSLAARWAPARVIRKLARRVRANV